MENSNPLYGSMSSDSSLGDSTLYDSSVYPSDSSPLNSPEKKKPEGGGIGASIFNGGAKLFKWGCDTASTLGASTVNFVSEKTGQVVSYVVVGQLKGGIEDLDLSENTQEKLKYIDKSGKLPRIISKFIRVQITPDFMKENNLGGDAEDLQDFLNFLLKQAVASLACYRPGVNLPISVIDNFISIINSWLVKSGLQEKLKSCRRLHVTTHQIIKSKNIEYAIDKDNLSKNASNNSKALKMLAAQHNEEIDELIRKLAEEQKEFTDLLDYNIPKLVTILFHITEISEDWNLQGVTFQYLQIRSKLEKNLRDFIYSFYFKALPRREARFKEPLLQCLASINNPLAITQWDGDTSEYKSLESDEEEVSALANKNEETSDGTGKTSEEEDEFGSLDFATSIHSENKNEIESLGLTIREHRPNNTNEIVMYNQEQEIHDIPREFFLDEVIEPQLPLLTSGILGVIEVFLFNYTKSLRDEEPRRKAVEAVSGLLTDYGISEVDDWLEDVLKGIVSENSLIAQLRSIFVECLAYRFVEVIEKLADLKPRAGLDLLESLLLNIIDLTEENLHLQKDFSSTIQEYKNLVILDEAYGWRDHFLQSQLKLISDQCDDLISTPQRQSPLRSTHIQEIFRLAKCSEKQIYDLAAVLKIENLPKGNLSQICAYLTRPYANPLIEFFRESRKPVQKKLQDYLTRHFGQFAEALLKATGLDQDEAIGFCEIFKSRDIDLNDFRKRTVPKMLFEAYCMVADLEERPLQKDQDQILIRFIEEYSRQERGDNFARESVLFGKVIKAFDERRFLKDDEIMLFSEKVAQAGYTWFSAVNYYMQQRLEAPDDNEEKLSQLDPNKKLRPFCESLRNKILVEAKKKIVKAVEEANVPYYMPAYDAVNENEEIQTFAKLYLDSILFRILSKLACEWNECQPNGLFSNILKKTLHSIQDSCNWDVFDGPATTKALLKAIGIEQPSDLHLIVLPFGNGKIEKMAFDEVEKQLPLLMNELCTELFILNQNQAVFAKIQGHGALEIDSDNLSKNIIPMAFRWMGGEKNRIALAHMIKDLLDENEIEQIDRVWIEELLAGTALLEYDKWTLILDAYERRDKFLGRIGDGWEVAVAKVNAGDVESIFEMAPSYDKKKRKALLDAVKEPEVEGQIPQTDHEIFVEFFRKNGRLEAEEQKEIHTPGKEQVQNLWALFEKILTPRLFRVLEHAANHLPGTTGNILECILVNSICMIQDAFFGENTPEPNQLKAAVIEYERLSLLVEAYDWRNRYLKDVKHVKAAACEEKAQSLTFAEIQIILEENFDKDRLRIFLKAIGMPVNDDVDIELKDEEPLLEFFRKSSQEDRKLQKECLSECFGPVANRVLELTGLTNDAAFSLPGASEGDKGYYSLESIRTQLVPQILLTFYKDMSDFHGVHEKNMQDFEAFFGEHSEVAMDIVKTFSSISTEKAKTYVSENAGDIAVMVSMLFPTATLTQIPLLTNAIRGIVSSNSTSFRINAEAAEVLHRQIEERIFGSLIQLVTSLIMQEGEMDSSEEDVPVNDHSTDFGSFIRRRLPGFTGSPERPRRPSGENPKPESLTLKQNEGPRPVFSHMWFSNILQCFGDVFEDHREGLKIGMREYRALEEWLSDENLPDLQKEERKVKKLKAIFQGFTQELVEISGLSKRNLYLPEFCQDDIWETLTEDVLPLFFAKFYMEMTVSQNLQKAEADVLKDTLPHGPGAATGFAHFIMKMLESQMAIDGNGMGKSLHKALIDFFIKSETESGEAVALGLGKDREKLDDFSLDEDDLSEELLEGHLVQSSLNEIISDAVRSERLTGLFAAIEGHVVSPLQRMLGAIKANLTTIDTKPDVLTKIAKVCILDAGEHFLRLHSVAYKENKESAYELVDSPSTILEGISWDRPISEYILLKEARKKAEAIYRAAKDNANAWYLTDAMRAERKVIQEAALDALVESRRAVRRYARTIWADQRVAVEAFLEAERKLGEAAREEASIRDRLSDSWMANWINSVSKESQEVAKRNREHAQIQLDEADKKLKAITINVVGGQNDAKANPLKNLCSLKEYREKRKTLEDAQNELESSKKKRTHNVEGAQRKFDKAFKDFEQYRINEYFTPLAAKILKLVGDEPFNNLDFPTALPESIKETMIEQIKGNLPEILNMLFHNLVKPETQQGILLKFVRDANKATTEKAKKKKSVGKEVVVDNIEEKKKHDVNGFEDRSGKMALHLIDMLPKGSLEIFHRLSAVKEAIEEGGGKYIADTLSSSLEETSMVQLFDSLLELAVTSSMPDGTWDDALEFTPNMKPLPKTPEELDEAKRMNVMAAHNIKRELQDELTIFMENEIASQIMAPLEKAGNGFLGGVRAFIHSVFDGEAADEIFKVFEDFAHNVYNVFHAIMSLIASVTFWPVARWFIGTMPQDITETFSLEAHENLVFQWVNVVMDTIDEELGVQMDEKDLI